MLRSIQKKEVRNENYYFDDDNYAHFDQAWTLNINANYAYSKGLSRTEQNCINRS
jgi:hypothetical protein